MTCIRYCGLVSRLSWTGHALVSALAPPLMGRGCTACCRAWEQVRDTICPDATHPGGYTVLEMREPLRQLYRTYHYGAAPHCRGAASRFREIVAPTSRSQYLLFLQEDYDNVLAALQPHGMMSQDMVQSVNRFFKVGYNDHSDHGGGR